MKASVITPDTAWCVFLDDESFTFWRTFERPGWGVDWYQGDDEHFATEATDPSDALSHLPMSVQQAFIDAIPELRGLTPRDE